MGNFFAVVHVISAAGVKNRLRANFPRKHQLESSNSEMRLCTSMFTVLFVHAEEEFVNVQ